MRSSLLKAGMIGAVVYTLANVVITFAAFCGFSSADALCSLLGWSAIHLFPSEHLEEFVRTDSIALSYLVLIVADCVIGFVLGVVIAKLFSRRQKA